MFKRILFFLSLACPVLAQSQDTTVVYRLPEVVVTATRSLIDVLDSPSPAEIIAVDHASALLPSLGDIVGRSTSMFLRDLGGSGALKTAFLRGTAPQHLLVLVNGVRQNSHQNGLVDFTLLSVNDVQRVEIVRGGSSALFGADALGGVVNILTRTPETGLRVRLNGEAGSYGFGRWRLEGEGRPGGIGLLAGAAYEQGRDEFPYRRPDGSSATRTNADFRKRTAYMHGDAPLGAETSIRMSTQAVRSERGVPGSLSFLSPEARQADDDALLGLEVRHSSLPGTQLSLKTSYHYSFQTYKDSNPLFPFQAAYRNGFVVVNPELHAVVGDNARILAGAEWNEGVLTGTDFTGAIRRVQRSLYASGELRLVWERPFVDLVTLYGMMRYDDISDVDEALMPKVGINVRLLRDANVRFRASYGASFRSPSFNDLYYVGVSNPDLKPEHSASFDAGVLSAFGTATAAHHLSLTYFNIGTRDRIVFDLATFRPVNIGRTRSTGLEGKYTGSFWNRALELEVSYAITDAVKRNESAPGDPAYNKQLLFIPRHSADIALTGRWNVFEARVSYGMVGKRYTSEDHLEALPEYHVTDCILAARLQTGFGIVRVAGEVRNVFDRSYEVFEGYPMPGRTMRIGIGIEY
ncbi:MAG: TonB-dependent receptor [Ignavibacterium sp.]|jgi:outer membrane cobalamin receptor